MPEIGLKEQTRAAFGQAEKAPVSSNTEAQRAKMLQEMIAHDRTREAMTSLATGPVDSTLVNTSIEAAISGDRDPSAFIEKISNGLKSRTGDNLTRHADAHNAVSEVNLILEKGWQKLTPAERNAYRPKLENALRKIPALDELLKTPGINKNSVIDNLASNPKFALNLSLILEGRLNPNSLPKEISREIIDNLRKSKLDLEQIDSQRTRKTEKLREEQAARSRDWEGKGKKPLQDELSGLEAKDLDTQKAKKAREVESSREELAYHKERSNNPKLSSAEREDSKSKLADLTRAYTEQSNALDEIDRNIARRTELRQTKQDLDSRIDSLEQEIEGLTDQFNRAQVDLLARQAEYEIKLNERNSQEIGFVDNLKRAVEDAASETVQQMLAEAAGFEQAAIDESIKKATSTAEERVRNLMKNRWYRIEDKRFLGIRNRKQKIHDKANIEADWRVLLEDGPQQLIKERLLQSPEFRDPTKPGELSQAGIDAMKEPQMLELTNEYAARLMKNKLETSKLSNSEAELLMSTEWGSGVVEAAISQSEQAKQLVESLKQKGLMRGGPIEFFRNQPKWLQILLALIAVPGLALAGVGVMTVV